MIALFDHEEVGSGSLVGASSSLLPQTMNRIIASLSPSESEEDAIAMSRANSFMFSLDMAHGLHPNYSARHESSHRPLLNGGLVLKENPNQRFLSLPSSPRPSIHFFVATPPMASHDSSLMSLRSVVARFLSIILWCGMIVPAVALSVQCKSTSLPRTPHHSCSVSQVAGITVADIGMPQLSMHSVREMMGARDLEHCHRFLMTFFRSLREVRHFFEP